MALAAPPPAPNHRRRLAGCSIFPAWALAILGSGSCHCRNPCSAASWSWFQARSSPQGQLQTVLVGCHRMRDLSPPAAGSHRLSTSGTSPANTRHCRHPTLSTAAGAAQAWRQRQPAGWVVARRGPLAAAARTAAEQVVCSSWGILGGRCGFDVGLLAGFNAQIQAVFWRR